MRGRNAREAMHVANKVKAAELNKNAVRDSPFEDR